MERKYPDYTKSITNITCTVLRYFGVKDVRHNSLPELEAILNERKPRNIVMMLFDAMGTSILKQHLSPSSFTRRHVISKLSSTFPPTTTAATTSINSGLTPLENGWLGWISYFKEVDENVITFFSTKQSDEKVPACDFNLAYRYIPYKTIAMQVHEVDPEVNCIAISPFPPNPWDKVMITDSVETSNKLILDTVSQPGKHLIYAYWPDPDHTMHDVGVDHPSITEIMKNINENLRKLSHQLGPDTLAIVTADHSQINSKWFYLEDYPDVYELLLRPHSMEHRAATYWVKPGMQEVFRERFNSHFSEHFKLMTHDEFLSSGLLGTGSPHPRTDGFVGDFIAIATDEYCISERHGDNNLVGIHAGFTDEEMEVPLIVL